METISDEDIDERQQGIQRANEWGIDGIKHGYFFVRSRLHEHQRFVTFRDKKWDAHYIGICTQRSRPDNNKDSTIKLTAHENQERHWMITSHNDMGIYFFCYRIDFYDNEMTSHVLTSLRLCPIHQSSFYIGQDEIDLRYKWFSDVFYFKDDPYFLDWNSSSENEHFVFRYPHRRTQDTEADTFQPFMVIPLIGKEKTKTSTIIKKDENELPPRDMMFDKYQLQDRSQHYIWKPQRFPNQVILEVLGK
jgi:hypothetical protein